jgi:hypothetical protein
VGGVFPAVALRSTAGYAHLAPCGAKIGKTKNQKIFVTLQLPNPNNSAPDNIALRTALALQPLFIKFPLGTIDK